MKIQFKRITRFILTAGACVAPISLAVSCANEKNYGDSWELKSHRNINLLTSNGDGINETYGFPNKIISLGYDVGGSVNAYFNNSQQLGLFSKVKDKYDSFKKDVNNIETKINGTPHRESFLKFELIKSVVLNFQDKSTKTFNSDKIDENDKNSINGKDFKNSIKSKALNSIEFIFSDDVKDGKKYWTEEISGKKRGVLKPEDIWTYVQMRIASNDKSREKAINETITKGAQELISKINSYVNKKSHWEPLQKSDNSSARSFWISNIGEENYGIDFKKFLNTTTNKKDFLGINNSQLKANKIVIPFSNTTTPNKQWNFWKTQIKNFNIFAISSDNINYLTKKYVLPRSLFNSDKDYNKFLNSEIYKTGIFSWYMANEEKDYVSGGKYYLSKNDKKIRELKANPNYINYDEFFNLKNSITNKKTTILSFSQNFIQQTALANTIILQAYKEGFTTNADTSSLSSKEYNNMLSNPKKWGMKFNSGYTADNIFGDYSGWHILPGSSNPDIWDESQKKMVKGKNNYNVYYNDWYSKVMWGNSVKDLIKQQPKNNNSPLASHDWADHYYGGTGIQFMTNLLAAFNSYTAVHNFNLKTQDWTSVLAPENPIQDYSNKYSNNKVIYQAHPDSLDSNDPRKQELIKTTSKFGLSIYKDSNGQKNNMFKHVVVNRDEYIDVNKNPIIDPLSKYGPPSSKLKTIKNNIKLALDNAGVPQNQKVTFEWPIARLGYDIKMNVVYESAIKWLNSLDSRLNIVAMLKPHKENIEENESKIIQQNYTKDFKKISQAVGNAPAPWIDRLLAAKGGYGAINLNNSGKYTINSPAGGIFNNLGYLQTGKLMGLSYYADHKNLIKGNVLEGLKPLIDVAESKFNNLFSKIHVSDYKSQQVKNILNNMKSNSPKFKDLYKNTVGDIISYDYFGMHGFEEFKELLKSEESQNKNHKDFNNIRSDLDKFGSRLSGVLNSEFMNEYQQRIEDNTYNQISVLKSISAFNILTPVSINPFAQIIGNRKNPGIILEKNWFFNGTDTNNFKSYEWYRVDLYKDENGEIQGGGI